MGNYINTEDVKRVLPENILMQLTNDYNRNIALDNEQVNELIEEIIVDAEDKVNSYLRGRYDVPLAAVPDLIKRCTLNITRYYLYDRRNIALPDNVKEGMKETGKELMALRNGILELSVGEVTDEGISVLSNKDSTTRMFGDNYTSNASYNLDNY